jgi:hypothetical protein
MSRFRCLSDGKAIRYLNVTKPQPNPEPQIPTPKQIPSTKFKSPRRHTRRAIRETPEADVWHTGNWDLEFVWDLVLGVWDFKLAPQEPRLCSNESSLPRCWR